MSERRGLRVVLDTNVWVSAMIWGGSPASIVRAAEDGRVLMMVSEEIIQEISRTLAYPRLREMYEGVGVRREELVAAVLRVGKLVKVTARLKVVREDFADNMFLECALDGDADCVVSGDDHLLSVRRYKRIRILSVKQFLKLLEHKDT